MFEACGPLQRRHKGAPPPALRRQHLSALGREFVVPSPALPRGFHPLTGDEAFPFEPVENRIERSDLKRDRAFRPPLDLYSNLITMTWSAFELREHQELGTAFFAGIVIRAYDCHIVQSYI